MSTKTKTQPFDELMGKTEDDIRKEKVALARRTLQRMFASAADDAARQRMEDEAELMSTYNAIRRAAEVTSGQVQHIIDTKLHLRRLEITEEVIGEEYKALFGEELKVE